MDIPQPPSPSGMMEDASNDDLVALIDDLGVGDEQSSHDGAVRNRPFATARHQPTASTAVHSIGYGSPISPRVAEQRIQRTRERNRQAQARYRQKLKEQCVTTERQVQELQARLGASLCNQATLQHANDEHKARISTASAALARMHADAVRQPAHSPCHSPTPSAPSHHNPGSAQASADAPGPSSIIAIVGKREHRGLATDPNAIPAPIHSFKHSAGVSYELLYRAASRGDTQPDSAQPSFRRLIEQFKDQSAASVGCSPSQVCWFAVLDLEASPGTPLSYSSTFSTPECVASFVLHYTCSCLECSMITAACDELGKQSIDEEATDAQDPHKRARTSGLGPPGVASAGPHSHRHAEQPAATQPAQPGHTTGAWQAAGVGCSSGQHDRDSHSHTAGGHAAPHAWSGAVRCGVGGTIRAPAGVASALRGAVEPFMGIVPLPVLRQLLHAAAQRGRMMLTDFTGEGLSGEGPAEGPEEYRAYYLGVMEAIGTVVACAAESAETLSAELPTLEAQTHGRRPPSRQWLLDRSAKAITAQGLGFMLTFREAPRIIRRLAVQAVVPLLRYYEVENMQVMLYRSLRTTPAQRERMAAYWSAWERRNRELDSAMDAAREALWRVPARLDLPVPIITQVSGIASGACSMGPVNVRLGMGRAGEGGMEGGVGAAMLLGSCVEATVGAQEALELLWAVHVADGELHAETMDLQFQPGLLIGLDQFARVFAGHLTHATAPVDFMALCQLAKTQHHRDGMFKKPRQV